ncbi:hypothetical protein [Pseudonocardia sp. GCM10023141]|uniref:hypothetical protein n=1 Tax=Pseudonocardia sp. GCM10023141 TaxID=3252653 RepID=UPI0036213151
MLLGLLFALTATLLNSAAGLLQAGATRRVPRRHRELSRLEYVAGMILDALGWAATVVALRHLPVFVVQAVLGGAIAVTAVGARLVHGTTLRARDRIAVGGCVAGLALVAASASEERPAAVSPTTLIMLFVAAGLLVVALVALRDSGRSRPSALVAGLGFGGTSLAVRAIGDPGGTNVVLFLLSQPATYLVVAFWAIGLISYTRALGLGTLAQVTAVLVVTETIVPGLVGIAVLGEGPRPGWWIPMIAGLAVAVAGVVVLSGSPAHRTTTTR